MGIAIPSLNHAPGRFGRRHRNACPTARMPRACGFLAFAMLWGLPPVLGGGEIHVPGEVVSIQSALDAAQPGDTVVVAPGVYILEEAIQPSRAVSSGERPVTLRSEAGRADTVIRLSEMARGSALGSVLLFDRPQDGDVTVEGFTLTGGTGAEWDGPLTRDLIGGGIACKSGASPTIIDCWIVENEAVLGIGGGVGCVGEGTRPRFIHCRIESNVAGLGGGVGLFGGAEASFQGCDIAQNYTTSSGGGIYAGRSRGRFEQCTISRNRAYEFGGGLAIGMESTLLLGCAINANHAEWGGGIWATRSNALFHSCTIRGNSGLQWGGAVGMDADSTPWFVNCLLAGNGGLGLYADLGSAPKVHSCTITGNSSFAMICVDGSVPEVMNSIIFDNGGDTACGTVEHTLIGEDPLFVLRGTYDFGRFVTVPIGGEERSMPDFVVSEGDYRLEGGSPAIDAGLVEGAPTTDIQGQGRPCGAGMDIGAYELGDCPVSENLFVRGDADRSGVLDISDPLVVLLHLFLGEEVPGCIDAADADDNGSLDLTDALYTLSFLFLGGPSPEAPFPHCGIERWIDGLGCEEYPLCP